LPHQAGAVQAVALEPVDRLEPPQQPLSHQHIQERPHEAFQIVQLKVPDEVPP
jgi:hypothetical protein